MKTPRLLVIAKAPVPGQAKTRLSTALGDALATDVAAAALLDTLDVAERWAPRGHRLIAWTGSLAGSLRTSELAARLSGWTVLSQRGGDFGQRLMHAHHDAAAAWGPDKVVVQIATDTPQLTIQDLDTLVGRVSNGSQPTVTLLGPAVDGGWWGLETRRAGYVEGLGEVPMSTPHTFERTAAVPRTAGARVRRAHVLWDVDTFADARRVAADALMTRFAATVNDVGRGAV